MALAKSKARPAPVVRKPAMTRRVAPVIQPAIASLVRNRAPPAVQTKLMVGAANDPAEKEADTVAAKVTSMSQPLPVVEASPVAAPIRRSAMDQPSTDALATNPPLPAEQADLELPKAEDVKTEGLSPEDLKEIEDERPAQPSIPMVAGQRAPTAAVGPEGGAAPAAVAQAIEHPGPGRPLPKAVRADLEPRFGADFGDVRLHDGPADRDTAAAIGARAFAYKSDIWLGAGERAEDRHLMAHELTHVLQQTGRHRSPLTRDGAQPARQVNRFVGDAIREKVEKYARRIPGYSLISYILGKTPVAGKKVYKTAENLIYAVMELHPLGSFLTDRLKETKAVQATFDWLSKQVSKLNINWTRIKGIIAKAEELFSIRRPLESIKPAFTPVINDMTEFVVSVKDKVLEFILKGALKLAGSKAEQVWGVIQKAGDTIKLVLDDPLGFAKNLFKAVGRGFGKFFDNILKHLKNGLMGFIFGSLGGLEIELPKKLDLEGFVSLIFQVLRLTWKHVREKLVKRLGPNGERKVAILEKSVDIIKLLLKEGIMGVWQKLLAMIDNLTQTVLGGITTFITTTLVKAALGWLAGLSNPVGAVVKVALMIYDFVVMLIERMTQIMEFVQSVFGSIAAIAKGNIENAAQKVEDALGRTLPLIFAFLAAIIPISGIASKIQSIMKKLRAPVDKAITKLIKWLVKKGKKVLAKVLGKLNGKRKMPGITIKIGKDSHQMFAEKKGKRIETYIKSVQQDDEVVADAMIAERKKFDKDATISDADRKIVIDFITAFNAQQDALDKIADRLRVNTKDKSLQKEMKKLEGTYKKAQTKLNALGERLVDHPNVDTSDDKIILRYKVAMSELEGMAGKYAELQKLKDASTDKDAARALQLDHNPNLAALKEVRAWLEEKKDDDTSGTLHFSPTKRGGASDEDKAKASMGTLSVSSTDGSATQFTAMAIYGPYNNQMQAKDKERGATMKSFLADKEIPADLGVVRGEIKRQLNEKLGEVKTAYGGEPKVLQDNVKKGRQALFKLANDALNLSDIKKGKEQSNADPSSLARAVNIKGATDRYDFMQNEGAAGSYSSLSGKKTMLGFLEADHSPMKSEMQNSDKWTIKSLIGERAETALTEGANLPALAAGPRTKAKAQIKAALSKTLSGDRVFTESKGSAVVVAKEVNQNAGMKQNVSDAALQGELRRAVSANAPKAKFVAAGQGIASGESGDAAIDPLRRTINRKIQKEMLARIKARQARAFNLYATLEAPKISKANAEAGKSEDALKLLAVIAAKVKSDATVRKLSGITNEFFPG